MVMVLVQAGQSLSVHPVEMSSWGYNFAMGV